MNTTIKFYNQERDSLMAQVELGIRRFCKSRNLFAWQEGIEDILSMVAEEMCKRDFKGKPQFYVSIGTQLAISKARDYSAHKRRINYDYTMTIDIDDAYNLGEVDKAMGIIPPDMREDQIIASIKKKYGDKVALYVQGIFKGTELVDKNGKELSTARLAQAIKKELKGEKLEELKEFIKQLYEDEQ